MSFFGALVPFLVAYSVAHYFYHDTNLARRMEWAGSIMIGFGMLGRAELAFVVMNIAYVQYAILNTEAFYMLMFTIFWLNVLVAVTIRFRKPCYLCSLNQLEAS